MLAVLLLIFYFYFFTITATLKKLGTEVERLGRSYVELEAKQGECFILLKYLTHIAYLHFKFIILMSTVAFQWTLFNPRLIFCY